MNRKDTLKIVHTKWYDEAWLDFVTACRSGRVVGDFDILIGGIANDKVFQTKLTMLFWKLNIRALSLKLVGCIKFLLNRQ